ncbi:MAG: two-component sensor histidine kinase [Methylibium sp.]|nr:two-component sensor histidine kinase [Methylibium sp.]
MSQPAGPDTAPARPPLSPRRRGSGLAWLIAALLLLMGWSAAAYILVNERRAELDSELRQSRNLARVLSEQTLRVIASTDQAMQRLIDARLAGRVSPQDLLRAANETGLTPQILAQLALIDASGRFQASNLDPDGSQTGPVDLSDREHVQIHLRADSGLGGEQLFIGKPVLGKVSGRWTIQLSRAIRNAEGVSQGVVVASLDPGYFEEVYKRVDLGDEGSVALLGRDLDIRAQVVGGKSGTADAPLPPDTLFRPHAERSEGDYASPAGADGTVARLHAFRRVADYPLFVLVSTAENDALQDWRSTRNSLLAAAVLLSAVVIGAAAFFVYTLRRLERSNEALRQSEARAQAASQAKSEFLAAVSHELRTPLTSIRGFAELMERRLPDERYRESAGLIRKGAEHLNHLLTEILDLAKVEAGAMALNAEAVELSPLLSGTLDFFILSAQAKGLKLSGELAPDVPSHVVCDGLRLKQILNNLLSNAIKFTESGEVKVTIWREGEALLVRVSDTGPGIAPEKQALIFEKFRQGDAQVSTQHGGTGLGLALSKALAELMHGQLTLESRLGEGASFTLRMPLVRR